MVKQVSWSIRVLLIKLVVLYAVSLSLSLHLSVFLIFLHETIT